MCHSLASYGTGIRVLFGWQAKFNSVENTLIPNRERGAIFNLVGSFGINISGDPHLVPLSLEGLSKATTCIPHRICSMWMTCVNATPMHGHTRTGRIHWSPTQGSVWFFPELFLNGLVHMWLKWRRSSIKSKQWGHCKDQLCWHLKSFLALWISMCKIGVPASGSQIDYQGSVVFSVLERKWEQLPTVCICHYEVELPGSYGCLMIGEAEASSYNAECMWIHIWILGSWCSIQYLMRLDNDYK